MSKSNIVVFLVDDMGIGDIGCYGSTTLMSFDTEWKMEVCHRDISNQ